LVGDRVAEQVERLAHHALRSEVWDKALAYCQQAGEKVMARSAYREAVGYFEQALSALQHLPEQRDTIEQAIDLRLDLLSARASSSLALLAWLRHAWSRVRRWRRLSTTLVGWGGSLAFWHVISTLGERMIRPLPQPSAPSRSPRLVRMSSRKR